jgi:hypothetical protein
MAGGNGGAPQPRDERGRFARIAEHMGGVTIMESRTNMAGAVRGADGELDAAAETVDGYARVAAAQ